MVTKQEALAVYNEQHGTTYTLTSLAVELLRSTLKDAWFHKRYNDAITAIQEDVIET